MLRLICGLHCEFRGLEKIPQGAALIASKHQSLWETFALITVLKDPAYILKRELLWIPFFGWCAWKADMIPVDRGARSQALAAMTERAQGRNRQGPRDHHLSGRHAPRARRRAEIQVRRRVSLRPARHSLRAGGAEFGAVLAAPFVHALSGHGAGGIPRSDRARARSPDVLRPAAGARSRRATAELVAMGGAVEFAQGSSGFPPARECAG